MKYSTEYIKEYVNGIGCKLIERNSEKITLECPECNDYYIKSFADFRRSKSPFCPSCSIKNYNEKRRLKNEYISREFIESVGCKLLSPYVNARTPLLIRCKNCNNTFERTLDNFKRFKAYTCKECSMKELSIKTSKRVRHSYKWVRKFIENKGSKLLSSEYDPKIPLVVECRRCKKPFERLLSVIKISGTVYCKSCGSFQSNMERELHDFMDSLNINYIQNDRKIIKPLELDVFIPSKNLAIELDGVYWHSELQGKNSSYHLHKTDLCEKKGVQLIHIFENEWNNKKDIVKSIIRSKLGLQEKLYARKCIVRKVSTKDKDKFLEENHIQGKDKSSVRMGLYYNYELVSIMTFGKSRFNKNTEWEIIRFCSKKDLSVVGGASRLLKTFLKRYTPKNIITHADKRYSTGNLYEILGFDYSHDSKSNYFYYDTTKKTLELHSRQKFQKHKLSKLLEDFKPELTEWENMKNNGWDRIWDCGNKVYYLFL